MRHARGLGLPGPTLRNCNLQQARRTRVRTDAACSWLHCAGRGCALPQASPCETVASAHRYPHRVAPRARATATPSREFSQLPWQLGAPPPGVACAADHALSSCSSTPPRRDTARRPGKSAGGALSFGSQPGHRNLHRVGPRLWSCAHVQRKATHAAAGRSSFPIAFWSGDKTVKCLSPLTVFALHSASPAAGRVLRPAAGTAAMVGRPRMPASSWAAVPRRPFTSSDTRQQGWLRRKFRVRRQSAAVDPCVERVR